MGHELEKRSPQGKTQKKEHRGNSDSSSNGKRVNEVPTRSELTRSSSSSSSTRPAKSMSTIIKLSLASGALALVSWFSGQKELETPLQAIPLPETYAICSQNGQAIYTVDRVNSKVQCLLIQSSRIADSGNLDEITQRWEKFQNGLYEDSEQQTHFPYQAVPLTVRYLPDGAIVVPGLCDSHGHTLEYGGSRELPLEGAKNIEAAVQRVRKFILDNPDVLNDTSRFISGWGWDHTAWSTNSFPKSTDLEADPIVRGRRIILQSKDGHAIWVSASVLRSVQPLPDDIEGGVIVRDDDGNPTGVFLDNAQDLAKKPAPTEEDLQRRFHLTVKDALSHGLTSIHDAGFDPESLAFFQRQAELGELPIRIYGMTYFDESSPYWGDQRRPIVAKNRLTARSVKIFADGALRSGGAALFEPYADNSGSSGFMRLDPEILFTVIPRYLRDGWQVNVHAIGDRANALVLDAFQRAHEESGVNVTALRPRIEHAQLLTGRDMERVGELGVIASVQPTHVISDMWYAEERLGPERIKNLYAFRSILDNGGRITLGSDFPVESLNPLSGFYAAITRLSPEGTSPRGEAGWFPEQRLTRVEALRGMTIDAAYASFFEDDLGSLETGKFADFVVLSQDIMSIPVKEILKTTIVATVLDGRLAFGQI